MITPTDREVLGAKVPTFQLMLSEPSLVVSVHLMSPIALPRKALAVCLEDPARPDEAAVLEQNGWKFSERLGSSFVYAHASNGPAVVSLPIAYLSHPATSLNLTVHPWSRGADALAQAMRDVWFGVSRADGSLDVAKVVRS